MSDNIHREIRCEGANVSTRDCLEHHDSTRDIRIERDIDAWKKDVSRSVSSSCWDDYLSNMDRLVIIIHQDDRRYVIVSPEKRFERGIDDHTTSIQTRLL